MPAKVNQAFERGVSALFGAGKPTAAVDIPARNVFEVWNRLASKFPTVYGYASVTHKARATEEKLCLLLGFDPSVNQGRASLAAAFSRRLETVSSDSIEGALDAWWKELSQA